MVLHIRDDGGTCTCSLDPHPHPCRRRHLLVVAGDLDQAPRALADRPDGSISVVETLASRPLARMLDRKEVGTLTTIDVPTNTTHRRAKLAHLKVGETP